jgi:hypothetical protein
MSSLPYTLSAADAALFQSLQASALLPTLARPGEGELMEVYKQKKRDEEFKKVEPYADLLELKLTEQLEAHKETILQQLRESKDAQFTVDLFSWNTVHYYETAQSMRERYAEMEDGHTALTLENRRRAILIKDNKWESTFGVESEATWGGGVWDTYWCYAPIKVDRIFRHSDLAMRLSLKLGPNFFPSFRWSRVEDAGDDSDHGFTVYKKTFYVRYYPLGVSKYQMDKLLATAKKEAARVAASKKTGYAAVERGVGHEELCVLPEPEEKWSGVGLYEVKRARCFCGCADDE